jgi:POT family proton-dependent oligopeptide transporter
MDDASRESGAVTSLDGSSDIERAGARGFLGHPPGLSILFGTEMWERFSYYGMRSLLVLYLTQYLLLPGHVETVWGYTSIKSGFEFFAGPLDIQPLSSLIYGLYTGLIYLMPLLGGWIADRFLGQKRVVIIGIVLMALGHFMMAVESLLFPALLLLVIGGGLFKPNTTSQVGLLYAPGDTRRDRAYSIFYVGINIGAFLSPLVCGTLGEQVGWHYGFSAAGVGMVFALVVYLMGFNTLPEDELTRSARAHRPSEPLTREDWRAVFALLVLCIPLTLYWACYEQQGNTLALFAADNTDRRINLGVWEGDIPVTWFQSFNPLMIFAFTPLVLSLWTRQSRRGAEPNSIQKMTIGCFAMALANLLMVAAIVLAGEGGRTDWLWLFVYSAILTLGEIYLSPIALSLYSRVAPHQIVSTMIAVSFIPLFLGGGFLQGWLGTYWSSMAKEDFFLMIAVISTVAGIIIWLFNKPLKPILKG